MVNDSGFASWDGDILKELTLERCSECDEPTGNAGRYDDSLYIETDGKEIGPLCSECFHKLGGGQDD